MPLVLHIIDVKLSSQNKQSRATPDERRQTALKQHRLNVLIEAMKTYQPQYDGVDYISETIRHIVNLAQIDPPYNSSNQECANNKKPLISDWTDILASHPNSYLRLSMTMDISISKGRLARETDFPVKLRGLFAQGFSPIRALLAGSRPRPPDPQPAPGSLNNATSTVPDNDKFFVPNPSVQIQLGRVHSVSSDEGSVSPEPTDMNMNPAKAVNSHGNKEQAQPLELYSASSLFDDSGNMDCEMFGERDNMILDDIDYALTTDALTAYVMQAEDGANQKSDSTSPVRVPEKDVNSDGSRTSGQSSEQASEHGIEIDMGMETNWIDSAWHDEERQSDSEEIVCADPADKETARVLLEAMKDDSASSAA
jgi:hypothetical protein